MQPVSRRYGLSRRTFLAASSSVLLAGRSTFASSNGDFTKEIQAVRQRIGGRVGLHVLDTHSGRRFGFDDDSRYAMASTFKMAVRNSLSLSQTHGLK